MKFPVIQLLEVLVAMALKLFLYTIYVGVNPLLQGYKMFFFHNNDVNLYFFIPPQTLFVEGILFSRCPSVYASVRPSGRNVLFP